MTKRGLEESAPPFRDPATDAARRGAKRAVNVSVDAGLLAIARDMKINLSRTLEDALRKTTDAERARRFYAQHKTSIDSYNAHVERQGTMAENYFGLLDDPSV